MTLDALAVWHWLRDEAGDYSEDAYQGGYNTGFPASEPVYSGDIDAFLHPYAVP